MNELSKLLDISVSTLRKQLAMMQENGLLIRTYGGVMSVNRVPDETFESKMHKNIAEKNRIAERARRLVPKGCTIALGSGTTVYGLSTLLGDLEKTTVYVNSMQAADYLSRCAGLEVHICSGIIRSRSRFRSFFRDRLSRIVRRSISGSRRLRGGVSAGRHGECHSAC